MEKCKRGKKLVDCSCKCQKEPRGVFGETIRVGDIVRGYAESGFEDDFMKVMSIDGKEVEVRYMEGRRKGQRDVWDADAIAKA